MRGWFAVLPALGVLALSLAGGGAFAQAGPALTVNPSVGAPGSVIVISGTGFPASAGTSARVCVVQLPATCTNVALVSGSFVVSIYLPATVLPGAYAASAAPAGGATPVQAPFQVQVYNPPPQPVQLDYGIKVTPDSASPGDQVVVRGINWPVASEGRICLNTGSAIPPCAVSGSGSHELSARLTVPYGTAPGPYQITAFPDGTTFGAALGVVQVVGTVSRVLVRPTVAAPGTTVSLLAYTLEPLAGPVTATVTAASNGQVVGQASAPVLGDGSAVLAVPLDASAPPGIYLVRLQQGGQSVGATSMQVDNGPLLWTDSTVALPGDSIALHGSGFQPRSALSSHLTLLTSTGMQSLSGGPITVSASGTFTASVAVPQTAVPSQSAVSVSTASGATALASTAVTVEAAPSIHVTPRTQVPGDRVMVVGGGFLGGEAVQVGFTFTAGDGTSAIQQTTTAASFEGSVSVRLPIAPDAAPGSYTVTATGVTSGRAATVTLGVTDRPTLSVAPTAADPGSTITITGQNFAPNAQLQVGVQVTTPSGPVTLSASPSATYTGAFRAQEVLPASAAPGSLTVTATQPSASGPETASSPVLVTATDPILNLAPSTAAPGSSVQLSLLGFDPSGGPIALTAVTSLQTGQDAVYMTLDPDASGTSSSDLVLPPDAEGGPVVIDATQPGSGIDVSQVVQVLASGSPTAVVTSTGTPPSTPTSITTQTPPPTPRMKFAYARLRYPVVRAGTSNQLSLRANQGGVIQVHVVVTFPSGLRVEYRAHTRLDGSWQKTFPVPRSAASTRADVAEVAIRLQKGPRGVSRTLIFQVRR